MYRLLTLALATSLLALTACNEESASNNSSSSADIPADQIAATVNGTVISKNDIQFFKEFRGNPQIPDDQVLEEMIATELLREEAIKLGIKDKDNVRFQLRHQESETLARLLMREKFGTLSLAMMN